MLNHLLFTSFVAALGALAFLAGAALTVLEVPPGPFLTRAFEAARALYRRETRPETVWPAELWKPARFAADGVTVHEPDGVQPGLTLFSSGDGQMVRLIDLEGRVVHHWQLSFNEVRDPDVPLPAFPDSHLYVRRAHLYPNGDLLALYIGAGETPWGAGLVRMTAASEVLWSYQEQVHHDLDVGPDGRIYTLTHEVRTTPLDSWNNVLAPPRIDDFVVVLSPEGEELQKVDVTRAFLAAPFSRIVNKIAHYANGDYFHTNAIDVIRPADAAVLPFADAGQVLLSMRELGTIGLLDLDDEVFTWALRGPWAGQHDPDVLDDGRMLIFDNNGNYGPGGISRVIEFEPEPFQIHWQYAGDTDRPLDSIIRSAQQRLPNGNTLITESNSGRILEVTRAGRIVWEYVNPARGGEAGDRVAIVSWAERIDPRTLDPAFRATLDPPPD